MLDKDSAKTRKLLAVVALMIGLLCTIIAFGIMTRPGRNFERHCISDEAASFSDASLAAAEYEIAQAINRLTDSLDQMRYEYTKQQEEEKQTPQEEYWGYVQHITSEYYPDVDPDYVYAMIYHESRFKPDAVNKKTGVIGLMQISPKWHTERAKSLGVTDLTDPYGNILVGCDILHELTQKEDFNYAMNFFAGGYPYANRYRNTTSPYISALNEIIQLEKMGDAFGGV